MNVAKVKEALQDLIIRLQDAEKGYKEIHNGVSSEIIKRWMKKYADERHEFHKQLEYESEKIGGTPEVRTSFLGNLHRMFIDVKLNNIDDSLPAIITEIERGANVLIQDYEKVLDLELYGNLRILLEAQKDKITQELESLVEIKEELLVEA